MPTGYPSAEASLWFLSQQLSSTRDILDAAGDPVSGALSTIDYVHHEVHEGHAYIADIHDTSMAINEYIAIAFQTPAADVGRVHMFMSFASKAAAHLEMIEIPAVLTGGVPLAAFNRDRGAPIRPTGLMDLEAYDSTVGGHAVTGGTVLHDLYTWADKKHGGMERDEEEFILAPETVYAFKLTADANTNAGHIIVGWYERVHGVA